MKENKNKLFLKLAAVQILPMLILIVCAVIVGFSPFSDSIEDEIKSKLASVARLTSSSLKEVYDGDFSLRDGRFYIGENDLTNVYSIVDNIKKDTKADITLFVDNVRALTTVQGKTGDRLTGSVLENDEIIKAVYSGEEFYVQDLDLQGTLYYAYYIPFSCNANGSISGMVFAGINSESAENSKWTALNKIGIIFYIIVVVSALILLLYTRRIARQLMNIKNYIGGLSKSHFNSEMNEDVLKRNDEIGDLGRYAVEVGDVVNSLINTDPLTGLYNRRAGESEFKKLLERSLSPDEYYISAMLDIDFFKTLNDRFGHDYGDQVLVGVSDIMRAYSSGCGFVCRWGGEEFLIGLCCTKERSEEVFENILGDIRQIAEDDPGKPLITATIGAAYYKSNKDMYEMVNKSDECLYKGKNNGRNQIVTFFDA